MVVMRDYLNDKTVLATCASELLKSFYIKTIYVIGMTY